MRFSCRGVADHTTRCLTSKRGMTLIEVMVAALILLVAMAGIVPFFLTGISQASTLRFKSVANNIAREKMEQIRQLDYREIYTEANRASDPGLGTRTLESLFGTSTTERGSDFAVSYLVDVASYEDGYLKEVTVNVTWDAPPRVAPASMTTLVHQQFLGPRGSRLVIDPLWADPLGTPFPLMAKKESTDLYVTPLKTYVRYYIAQADWNLVFNNLDTATPAARNVYMRLALYDDAGQSIAIGDPANGYKLDTSHLFYSRDASGAVNAVWFEENFNPGAIPDGYWEMRAVVFNVYDEPGNTWRLRVRVETGAPAAPTGLVLTPQANNESVVLNWSGGLERDRSRYVIQRRLWSGANWLPWVTVVSNLSPKVATYTDTGSVAQALDPWGSETAPHYYQYSVYAYDKCLPAKTGASTLETVLLPPATTTTTVSSTPTSSTSTTSTTVANSYQVMIKNISNTNYSGVIKNTAGTIVFSGALGKNKTVTITGLPSGNYMITATANNKPTITQSFSLPDQAGHIVLTIL